MKLKIVTVMASILLLQACATPTVVETRKVNDNQLSCSQIQSEIEEAKSFEQKQEKNVQSQVKMSQPPYYFGLLC